MKIELSSHQSNAGSNSSGGNKEEKEENGGSDAQRNDNVNKEEMLALHEELKAARAETIKFEQRAVTAENEIEKFRKLEEELADVKKQESQLRGQYDEQAEKLKQAEDAAVKHMNTLAEHMKKSDDAIQSLEEQLCKAKADVDKWENRAVDAEAEPMEIDSVLDERIALDKKAEDQKKKTGGNSQA